MILPQKKNANTAALVWFVSMVAFVSLFLSGHIEGNIWDGGNLLPLSIFSINGSSLVIAIYLSMPPIKTPSHPMQNTHGNYACSQPPNLRVIQGGKS